MNRTDNTHMRRGKHNVNARSEMEGDGDEYFEGDAHARKMLRWKWAQSIETRWGECKIIIPKCAFQNKPQYWLLKLFTLQSFWISHEIYVCWNMKKKMLVDTTVHTIFLFSHNIMECRNTSSGSNNPEANASCQNKNPEYVFESLFSKHWILSTKFASLLQN